MVMFANIFLCTALSYLVGCFSPSYLIGKKRGYDPRESGSGNAGASNTIIMAGKKAGALVALLDILKAALCWRLAPILFPGIMLRGVKLASQLAGVACILGHMFPVFLGFRGGKGFACMGGCVIGYSPKVFLALLAAALLIAFITNYVCISTCCISVIWPITFGVTSSNLPGTLLLLAVAPSIIFRHRQNFRRIREGKEARFSYLWRKEEELARLGVGEMPSESESDKADSEY